MSDLRAQPKANPKRSPEAAPSLPEGAVAALVQADHGDPFAVLGPHKVSATQWEVRAMLPEARAAFVVGVDGKVLAEMDRRHDSGFFVARFSSRSRQLYRLRVETEGGTFLRHDPYSFGEIISDEQLARLRDGDVGLFTAIVGARPVTVGEAEGALFALWAPNARRVSVVGDFNGWDGRRHPMRFRHIAGIWELFLPGVSAGERYKFEIKSADGRLVPLKADPVAFQAEPPPATASILHGPPRLEWRDEAWIAARAGVADVRKQPMSIYECHLGSWARAEGNRYLTYAEMADRLVPYVRDMGFTHIELLPITEYPFDGSWGYQPVSLFAPTSRFGSPEDFGAFVEAAHAAGIGIILDWVPGHFPTDAHAFGNFDGTHLYEHADPRQGFHQDWGTFIYNFGREEVASFLIANARFWLEHYHLDGLRVDAVASMLYLDYSRKAGEWVPNRYGGNENLEAIEFLKRMNVAVYGAAPGVMTIAEESTAWPGVSHPTYNGGLGFGFKWNMGWMHDTLHYMSRDPIYRRFEHNNLTFGLLYAFSENFVLPLSHDEVVHGKGSLIGKMPGDRWQRFANLRAYFGFMWGHPGKKLLFMGGEFAQEREWNHDASLDWHLTEDPLHGGMQRLVGDLNRAYRGIGALHERDADPSGFEWIVADDRANSIIAWVRRGEEDRLALVISNFTPVPREGYRLGVPAPGFYREAINTDAAHYGGSNMGNLGGIEAEEVPEHGRPWSILITVPPLATMIFERTTRAPT